MEWKNLDTLTSFEELSKVAEVDLTKVMSGENGAERVKKYSTPMAEGLAYNYAAKKVDDNTLAALAKLAEEAQLSEKFAPVPMMNTAALQQPFSAPFASSAMAAALPSFSSMTGQLHFSVSSCPTGVAVLYSSAPPLET